MTSLIGVAELPLAIILWILAGLLTLGVGFALIVVALGAVSEYQQQKQKLRWDKMMEAIKK